MNELQAPEARFRIPQQSERRPHRRQEDDGVRYQIPSDPGRVCGDVADGRENRPERPQKPRGEGPQQQDAGRPPFETS